MSKLEGPYDWVHRLEARIKALENAAPAGFTNVDRGTFEVSSAEGLHVTGTGGAYVDGLLQGSGTLNWTGPANLNGNTAIGGSLSVSASATLSGNTTIGGSLRVTAETELGGATTISGATSITGDTDITGKLGVRGDTEVTGKFDVTGDAKFDGDVEITKELDVTADVRLRGDTRIEGETTLENDLRVIDNGRIRVGTGLTLTPQTEGGLAQIQAPNGLRIRGAVVETDGWLTARDNLSVNETFYANGRVILPNLTTRASSGLVPVMIDPNTRQLFIGL